MLESKFKTKQREEFEAKGWKFITLDAGTGGVPRGFPDTLCLSPTGYSCYVEWKQSKNAKKQPLQKYWNQKLNEMGHDAYFVYPENVQDWKQEILKKSKGLKITNTDKAERILTPLFVQARQEALKEANEIPLNRTGVVTSTPTKVNHLVEEALSGLNHHYAKEFLEMLPKEIKLPKKITGLKLDSEKDIRRFSQNQLDFGYNDAIHSIKQAIAKRYLEGK